MKNWIKQKDYIATFLLIFGFWFTIAILLTKFEYPIRGGFTHFGVSWSSILHTLPIHILIAAGITLLTMKILGKLVDNTKKEELELTKRKEQCILFSSLDNYQNCRVCGYHNADYPWGEDGKSPTYQICPCCGVEFGVDDITPENIQKFRNDWQKSNYKWFDKQMKPSDWSLEKQMRDIPKIGNSLENVE